jgi:hypothetical protein
MCMTDRHLESLLRVDTSSVMPDIGSLLREVCQCRIDIWVLQVK